MKAWHLLLGVGVVIGGAMLYGNMGSGGESPISAQLSATGIRLLELLLIVSYVLL